MRKPLQFNRCGTLHRFTVDKLLKIFTVTITLFFASIFNVSAQEHPVSGKIVSADGQGIPGVTVAVKGTNTGTVTDSTGSFSLAAPDSATLVISYIGFETQEVAVGSQTEINVTLKADKTDEVVVIGYGSQKKHDVTGSVGVVKSAELNRVVVADPIQALQGRVAGVNITQNTGAPGAPLTVQIRGVGTLGNSAPFYVVNGIPMDVSMINSNDIESISILKDASACAVYGSRAANGVVMITTKSGSSKKPRIDFNYLTGVSREWKRYNLLNAKEWATLRNEASMYDNGKVIYNNPDSLGQGTNWQDQIFQKGRMNSYSLGISGGSNKGTYYFGGSYLDQVGIIKNSDYKRYNFNTKLDYQVAKKLRVGTFVNTAFFDRNQVYDGDPYNSVIAAALASDPITQVYSGKGGDSAFANSGGRTDVPNPLGRLTNYHNRNKGLNFAGNWFGEYTILQDLKFKSLLGFTYNAATNDAFNGKYYSSASDKLDAAQVINQQTNARSVIWENSLTYKKTFRENHEIGGLLMMSQQDNRSEWFRATNSGTPNNDQSSQYLNTTSGTPSVSGGASENAIRSYLIRIDYAYKGKYLLTANMRRDGTSRFPKANRWGSFPSMAAGWLISEENFFEPVKDYINFLKLRASYGKLGNQNLYGVNGDYPYTTNITSGQNYALGGGAAPLGLGNKNIKWETVIMTNIGLDFRFLSNRLTFSVDYFNKKSSNMLIQNKVPYYSGTQVYPYVNAGEMVNKGLELAIEYSKTDGEFKYRVGGNFTTIRNRVTKMGDPIYDGQFRSVYTNITQQGSAIAQFYGWKTDGIVQTDAEAAALQHAQPGVRPGDFKFVDIDGDGVITDKDRTTLGSPLPKFTYGFYGDASFKGFDLNLFFQGVYGNKILNGSKYQLEGGVPYSNFDRAMLGRWTGAGSTNDMPRVSSADPNNNRRISNYYVESGSYLRLKSIQLGYTIPDKYTSTIKIQKLRLFVMAQNLLTITKYSGLDPEIGTYTPDYNNVPSFLDLGVDKGGTYPQPRTWFFGINATF